MPARHVTWRKNAVVVFVADDLGAWLVALLADASRKKLTTLVLGTDQQRALRQAAAAAIESTATELDASGGEQAEHLAMVVSEVFGEPTPGAPLTEQTTLLEALQAAMTERLSVLDDVAITGTGQSSAELLRVPGGAIAETLANHLVREIVLRGSRGGPLAPLANQLNHDVTHLQGQRLEGMLAQLADRVITLSSAGNPAAASQPVRLLPRPALLVGRDELLADLDTRLTGADSHEPRIVALCGLGGVGKTSVALEYAHRHLTVLGLAWQLPAEDTTVLAAGFGELAAQLGARVAADIQDPVASVHAILAGFPAPWLLIFDNAPDMASLASFLPPAGPGQVLITSQNQNWPHRQALQVPVLGTEVAADFLVTRTDDMNRQAAVYLSDELDGLPLALEQAAAYILATGGTLGGYLSLFQQHRADMLGRGELTGYDKTVATTWALAFDRLQQTAPGAVALLRLLAFYASEAIPLRLLLQPRPDLAGRLGPEVEPALAPLLGDELAAGDAVAELRHYSLVTPAANGSVSVHRLVQAATADQIPAELASQWRQAAAALIDAAIPGDTNSPRAWPVCAALLPHAETALTDDSVGMTRIANYLGSSGSFAIARDLQQRVLDSRERVFGPEHPNTLAARYDLAGWTGDAGDPATARDLLAELLSVEERVSGSEDPRTLAVRHELARWTAQAGDPATARDLLAELLPVEERVLAPEDPRTLTLRANLASSTQEAGDLAAARDQYVVLLPLFERVYGPENMHTLTVRNNVASTTGEAGDPATARDLLAELVPVLKRVYGPEHPRTLTARLNLAGWTGAAGDSAAAQDLFAELVPVLTQVLGPDHPDSLMARFNLAAWTGEAGDPAAARELFAELVPVFTQVLGSEHPRTLIVLHEHARWTGEAQDPVAARDLFAELLPVEERISGREHPDALAARHEFARWTGQAGDPAAARDLFAELIPAKKRVLGLEHPDTLTAWAELAIWTGVAGNPAAARDLLTELLPVEERVLGSEHPHTLADRHELAGWTVRAAAVQALELGGADGI
jgi:Tetratricopeptide repeat